jgi:hypothetical protein
MFRDDFSHSARNNLVFWRKVRPPSNDQGEGTR